MPSVSTYLAFLVAAGLIVAMPGPSVLFVIARSVNLGLAGGLRSVYGVALGALFHAVAVSLGLASFFRASPMAFLIVKNLGCLYLLYLGARTLLAKSPDDLSVVEGSEVLPKERGGIVLQGFLVELLNPKTALFFLAFLPQFASPERGPLGPQLLVLGLTFVGLGLVSDGVYALAAGKIGGWLKQSRRFRRVEKYVSGSVYSGLGLAGLFYRTPKGL